MAFVEIDPLEFDEPIIGLLEKEWALAMAGTSPDDCNAMTIEWGHIGNIWGSPSATIYIRGSRYTKQFVDANDTFSMCFLPTELHDKHKVFGTMSGRDVNKSQLTGLTPVMVDDTPIYEESRLVFVCRKVFASVLDREHFVGESRASRFYAHSETENDLHTMYIGFIEKILRKE